MSFKDFVKNIKTSLSKEVKVFSSENTSNINNSPLIPNWFWLAPYGLPRDVNCAEIRQFSKSAWVQMVKRTIKNQIMTTEWDLVNSDEEDKGDYETDIAEVKQLLLNPNRNGDTFWFIWGAFLDDVLDLDAGVVWKGRNVGGKVCELFVYDGSRFLIKIEEHSLIEGYYQYSYKFPNNQPLYFDKKDIIYGKVGSNTSSFPYGWAPLQSIQQELDLLIQSTRYNKDFFHNNAVPDGLVSLQMDEDALDRFRAYWETEVKGKPHKLIFQNSDMKFTPMAISNREMEWLDSQKWYFHIVFGAYGLSPAEVGFYDDVNRSSQEGQERTSIRNAIRPYYTLIEEKINREIIPEVVGHDKIKFKFFPNDDVAEKLEHEQNMQKLQQNVYTINEIRLKEGLQPVEWGDKPMSMVMQEEFIKNGGSEKFEGKKEVYGNKKKEEEKPEEKEESKKLYQKLFLNFVKNDRL